MKTNKRSANPLVIVLACIGVLEIAMTVLYPRLSSAWEKIPILAAIVLIPMSIVAAFIYLWIKRPGYLFAPDEFGSDRFSRSKLVAYDCLSARETLIRGLLDELEEPNKAPEPTPMSVTPRATEGISK